MRIGVPREIKDGELRVALTPGAIHALAPHEVVLEPGAGAASGFGDAAYAAAGASFGDPWECGLVVKVKELQEPEYARPRPGQTLFGFQHFGPHPELLDAALASGATFVAYETVGEAGGRLPILSPMSAIAGRLAVQAGAWCLQKQHGIGANVTVFARSERRFAQLKKRYPNATYKVGLERAAIVDADLIIAGVLTPGQMSPKLIDRGTLAAMRRGSALVDVGIDQGGIAETSRPTSHSQPIYVEEGVVHYCVPNMPAACARTASLALERAVLPYVRLLAEGKLDGDLATGVQVRAGRVVHEKLARDAGR